MRFALLALALPLAACGSDPDAASTSGPEDGADASTAELASSDAPGGSAGTTGADCLVGTWQIDPATMDPSRVQGMDEIPDADFSVGGSEGRALITFESDGDAIQRFEDFSVTINASVMGQTMSVRNNYSGTARATYRVEDGRIVAEPGEADLTATVSLNGGSAEPNPFATESVFETWERGRSAFTCEGDELLIDIYNPEDDTLVIEDVRYTRVAS
ncbi:MAG TPA: hypothetical protein EYQ24_04965 [Bacteroidetes bacterium]|nr:hypothetical protein [Bacteroidota bacterium]HIL58785.1 hypothetical protein [Rhodothermales bacterium]